MDINQESTTVANFETYRDVLYRRRWWFLLIAFGIWFGGWLFAWLLPAIYRSESVVLIEQQKVPEQYVVPNVSIDVQERLHSMTQTILSRTRLERIIDDLHLYSKDRPKVTMEELVDRMRRDIRIDLVQAPGKRDELTAFKLSYSSGDPHTAQQVTSQLTSLFIEENLRAREQQSESTTGFLQNQLEDARKQLAEQEQRIRDFKGKYLGQLPGQMQSNVGILSGLQGRLEAESDALNRAKQQNLYMQSLLGQYRAVRSQVKQGKTEAPLSEQLDREITTLKTQISDLSARYTDRHPDLLKARKQLAATEELRKKMQADAESADSKPKSQDTDAPRTASEVNAMTPIIELESQLKANDREIKDRQKAIDTLELDIAEYQRRLNETPVREQQLADLSRDYDQTRSNYESLLGKKNQSELATNLEKRQQGEQLRVLDPPSLPLKPYSPDRFRYSFFALVAGCILALLVCAALESIDDRVHSERDLKEFSTALLAEIPKLLLPSEDRALQLRNKIEWAAVAVIVLVIGVGNALAYYRG
jgi:succinoglycan biosynthesis transport protein ExoP